MNIFICKVHPVPAFGHGPGGESNDLKPGLHIVGRIVSMCLRPCPKEHITALQVSIAKISCERLLLGGVEGGWGGGGIISQLVKGFHAI